VILVSETPEIDLEKYLPDEGSANVNGVAIDWSRYKEENSGRYHYEWWRDSDTTTNETGYFEDMPSDLQENIRACAYEEFNIENARTSKTSPRYGDYFTTDAEGNDLTVRLKLDLNLTDLGNAKRFVHYHKSNVLYCHELKTWYIWDGKRWVPDKSNKIIELAKEVVATIYVEAGHTLSYEKDKRKEIASWAKQSESEYRLKAMLSLAQSERDIAVTADALDSSPWLLNCLSGTIDLQYNELLRHNRSDLITKLCLTEYDNKKPATSETWDDFLRDVLPDDELRSYVQRAIGYSLTGDTSEEVLFMPYGKAATGKSTFIEAIRAALGDYAKTADFESFLQRSFASGGPRNDIARLIGARFVSSIEVEEGKRFAEGLIKNITGGDTIAARYLHKEFFEYIPQFKLWFAVNNRPQISEKDTGMWRRIHPIPFENVIPEKKQNKSLKVKFRDPEICGDAILAWCIEGCLKWQQEGLNLPEKVKNAIKEYQSAMSPLGTFIEDECVIDLSSKVTFKDLYARYVWWCDYNDVKSDKRVKENKLTPLLKSLGFERDRDRIERKIKGLLLKPVEDKEEDDNQAAEVIIMREIAASFRSRPFNNIKTAICKEFLLKYPDIDAHRLYDKLLTDDKEFETLIHELNTAR